MTNLKKYIWIPGGFLAALIFVYGITFFSSDTAFENPLLSQLVTAFVGKSASENIVVPDPEKDRVDILILGIRGEDDPNAEFAGAQLTDTIQVLSFDRKTGRSALISLPRDLYVSINEKKKDKLNVVYEYGVTHASDDLKFVKDYYGDLAGIYIDKVIVFDFSSFKKIVDSIGGIEIYLDKPFEEKTQWTYSFYLPAGKNILNGQQALYYVRSRYSSNDFDRARRQQQVMIAIKDKVQNTDFLNDPLKSLQVLNTVRRNIRTDIGIWDLSEFLTIAKTVDPENLKHVVISTDNYVVESRANGAYILLPKNNSYAEIQELFKNILQ